METESDDEYSMNLIRDLKRFDPVSLDEKFVMDLIEEFRTLRYDELRIFKERFEEERIHPYISRLLTDFKSKRFGAVIDGSNIYHAGLKPSLSNFERLFLSMSRFRFILFPLRFVFDENIIYILRAEEKIKFERTFMKSRKVVLHSPADEMILNMAKNTGYFVISKDRFRDYNLKNIRLLSLDDDFRIVERER